MAGINTRVLPENTDPDHAFYYIDISSISGHGQITIPEERTIFATSPSRARRLAPPGSVIVSTVRTYLRAVAAVPETEKPLVFSTGFAVLEAAEDIDARFLSYLCQSNTFIDDVVARSTGVSYPAINAGDIGNIKISIPGRAEQLLIANFLDINTTNIASLIQKRLKQRAALADGAYAEISDVLLSAPSPQPRAKSPWPWLRDHPGKGPLVRLGYVCRLQNGLTIDSKRDVSGEPVTRPYLRVANVQAGYIDLSTIAEVTVPRELANRSTLRTGDVLMTEGGDLDKLGRGTVWNGELADCLHQNHVFALRPERDRLDGEYLALMTQTIHGRCYFESTGSKTTNLASTNSSKILSFPIPLPSVRHQRELTRTVHTKLDAIKRMKQKLDRQIALLAERRQALITAAVTGQIDVSTASGRGIEY
ncbi:restriction endonuclease subunit S [Micromonospora sp. NPDC000207]|uniref:restriction endonuclease subunit S n=1 Tax=Micromonospora sp. NPDC000207 TaxID=3154246 RepID=UPI003331B37C